MKHDQLRSIAHNLAYSLASGVSFLIGVYELDVFSEARTSPEGHLTIDFLNGIALDGKPSKKLKDAINLFKETLPSLCETHGGSVSEFREFTVRYYGTSKRFQFDVTIEDHKGKRSVTDYTGFSGKRTVITDGLGRVRTKPVKRT